MAGYPINFRLGKGLRQGGIIGVIIPRNFNRFFDLINRVVPERRKGNRRAAALFCACLLVDYGVMYALDAKLYESEPGWSEFEAFDEEATALLDYNAQPLN